MHKRSVVRRVAPVLILGLGLMCTGCAAAMGQVAGSTIGGIGWVGMKSGKYAYKGGTYAVKGGVGAVKVVGETGVAAGKAVNEQFGPEPAQKDLGNLAQN
jgi:hypothetical protein